MKPNEAQSSVKSDDRTFEQVFDRNRERVRGLWIRDDKYHARSNVDGITKRIPLQGAQTVSEAEIARQVLKSKIATAEDQAEQAKKVAPGKVAPGIPADAIKMFWVINQRYWARRRQRDGSMGCNMQSRELPHCILQTKETLRGQLLGLLGRV